MLHRSQSFVSGGLIALLIAAGAQAQQATAIDKRAILTGVAVDSIRGGFLRGASVFVSGTALSGTTDSAGRFRIEGIPPGARVLEIQHPLLDSLDITLATTPKSFADGDSSFVMLSVPSARTYAMTRCSAEDLAKGPAVIVGSVSDGDSGEPSSGASVSIGWTDYEIARKSITSTPHKRIVAVSPTGSFRICGLPNDFVAAVVASRGNDSTAAVELNLAAFVGIVSLKLPPPRTVAAPEIAAIDTAVAAPLKGTTFISGRVVDADGKPARGARVAIDADDAAVITGPDGSFRLEGVRPGTRRLSVRKIGFRPVEQAVNLPRDGMLDVKFTLGTSVSLLKAIVVSAKRDAGLQRVGFAERKRRQSGVFLTPRDVDIRNGAPLTRLLETVHILKRSCVRYFIDGFLQAEGDPDEYFSGSEVGAVEVYSPNFVPAQFFSLSRGRKPCAAVVVWTKWKIDTR